MQNARTVKQLLTGWVAVTCRMFNWHVISPLASGRCFKPQAVQAGSLLIAPTEPIPTAHARPLPRSVTGLAALLLTLTALLFEGASLVAAGRHGVLGWAADLHYLPFVAYLAVVPGIVGHTGGRQQLYGSVCKDPA